MSIFIMGGGGVGGALQKISHFLTKITVYPNITLPGDTKICLVLVFNNLLLNIQKIFFSSVEGGREDY